MQSEAARSAQMALADSDAIDVGAIGSARPVRVALAHIR
jgi:hypothetical protein